MSHLRLYNIILGEENRQSQLIVILPFFFFFFFFFQLKVHYLLHTDNFILRVKLKEGSDLKGIF